jgi:hypothetical protein
LKTLSIWKANNNRLLPLRMPPSRVAGEEEVPEAEASEPEVEEEEEEVLDLVEEEAWAERRNGLL